MTTYRRIDYVRERVAILSKLHQHFSTEGAELHVHRNDDVRRVASRRWIVTVHIPNLPTTMTMTFYGPTKLQALRNAHHLLQYYIKGPSTDDGHSPGGLRAAVRSVRERISNTGDDKFITHNGYV
jgi:hypothetical protein